MSQLEIEVPDDLYERLEKRAAAFGMTPSDYVADLARKMAALPTYQEMIERLDNLSRADIATSAEAVRAGREERDDQLDRAVSRD
jgi:predicted DNA-binding protein